MTYLIITGWLKMNRAIAVGYKYWIENYSSISTIQNVKISLAFIPHNL